LDSTFKNDAGFITTNVNNSPNFKFFFDLFYILLMILFVTQIIAGLIIDTFAALRERDYKIQEDKIKICFICGLDR
jgi:uncharacterized membrane protein YdcZ (DUF606 family)